MDDHDGEGSIRDGRGPLVDGGDGDTPGFYYQGTNPSSASIFEDVEMAQDEVSCGRVLHHVQYHLGLQRQTNVYMIAALCRSRRRIPPDERLCLQSPSRPRRLASQLLLLPRRSGRTRGVGTHVCVTRRQTDRGRS